MLLVIIVAFALGVVTSLPVGAVGQLMFNRLMKEGLRASFAVGLFSALLDAIYCEIGLVGISLVFDSIVMRSLVQGLSLLILLHYGYKHLLPMRPTQNSDNQSTVQVSHDSNKKNSSHLKHFFIVLTATIGNPTMFAFWVNMAHVLRSSVLIDMGIREYTLFSTTVGLGSAFCQYVVLRIVRDVRLFHSPTKKMVAHWLSASIFMLTISYFIYQYFEQLLIAY
jgi:threonine/homoserine/homoserine lactone efflux protein